VLEWGYMRTNAATNSADTVRRVKPREASNLLGGPGRFFMSDTLITIGVDIQRDKIEAEICIWSHA